MHIPSTHDSVIDESHRISRMTRCVARLIWHAIRLPILATLTVLEPLVCTLLSGVALLGILMALVFEFIIKASNYPFWTMLATSVGCALLVMIYYGLMRLFSSH